MPGGAVAVGVAAGDEDARDGVPDGTGVPGRDVVADGAAVADGALVADGD